MLETLLRIQQSGMTIEQVMAKAKDKNDPFRLSGFGHRVYKSYDPRAKVLKKLMYQVFEREHVHDPLLDVAIKLEEAALKDEMFAIGRLPGWIAHWKEMHDDPQSKINRPRQIYTGKTERAWIDRDKR